MYQSYNASKQRRLTSSNTYMLVRELNKKSKLKFIDNLLNSILTLLVCNNFSENFIIILFKNIGHFNKQIQYALSKVKFNLLSYMKVEFHRWDFTTSSNCKSQVSIFVQLSFKFNQVDKLSPIISYITGEDAIISHFNLVYYGVHSYPSQRPIKEIWTNEYVEVKAKYPNC